MMKAYASPLGLEQVVARIKELVDEREIDPSKKTFFRGEKEIVGEVQDSKFTLQQRTKLPWQWSFLSPGTWFKPAITGRIIKQDQGSMLELEGGANLIIKIAWALMLIGMAAIGGILVVFNYPVNIVYEPVFASSSMALGIAIVSAIAGLLILIPLIGWALTYKELDQLDFRLQQQLSLKPLPLR